MPEPTPSAPDAVAVRSWVWHATVESRAAGKVSVLACVETLLAVSLYWWIAIRWDTHWHLLTSVFIAPLLLLRSPESIKLGVQWFMKDWCDFKFYPCWSVAKRRRWQVGAPILGGFAAYVIVRWLSGPWLLGDTGWPSFSRAILAGGMSIVFAFAVLVAVAGAGEYAANFAGEFKGAFWGAFGGTFVLVLMGMVAAWSHTANSITVMSSLGVLVGGGFLGACAVAGVCAVVFVNLDSEHNHVAVTVIGIGVGMGFAIRALVCRSGATMRHPLSGMLRFAENWRDNNFSVDSCVPAELVPGIREKVYYFAFASDSLFSNAKNEGTIMKWVGWPLVAAFFFLPAFLYRLNIKATCWFWWPLAYLLKPLPQPDKASAQKQALCWPLDDPLQLLLILGPLVAACVVLGFEYFDVGVWKQFQNAAAVPIQLKVALGMRWDHLPPWHWALLLAQVCGVCMLWISCHARSHKANDNWDVYAGEGMKWQLSLMNVLMRVRMLAAVMIMLLGLGMCLISFPEWRQHLPGTLLQRLERFYHAQEFLAPAVQAPVH